MEANAPEVILRRNRRGQEVPFMLGTCQVCGRSFRTMLRDQPRKYCGPNCAQKAKRQRAIQAAEVPLEVRACRNCGEEFAAPITSRQRLCNVNCRDVYLPTLEEIAEAAAAIKAANLARLRASQAEPHRSEACVGGRMLRIRGRRGALLLELDR